MNENSAITNEVTYDVAAYLNSKERPQMSGLELTAVRWRKTKEEIVVSFTNK